MLDNMEIQFKFYQDKEGSKEIKAFFFDTRGGLDNVICGLDWSEIETEERLLHQLEKVLNLDLSFLDHWHEKVHKQYLEIELFITQLRELKKVLTTNKNYYRHINYPYVPKEFLEKDFSKAISSLID